MTLSLADLQTVNEMASLLYSFLPGRAHPFGNQQISFEAVAHDAGLSDLWIGGSKHPAITALLQRTLETRRDRFCQLLLEIVQRGLKYRTSKGNPINRDEITRLNKLIERIGFKIPELWNPTFLDSLPSAKAEKSQEKVKQISLADLNGLKRELLNLEKLEEHERGFAFQRFLEELFAVFGLKPRGSFRLVGEQIDGSLQLDQDTYLIEAKWQKDAVGNADLLILNGKVKGKATWSRGLFISYSGFTEGGIEAFSRGRSTNLIGMTGQDLYFILEGKMSLVDAIRLKARRAAETGQILVTVQ